MRALLDVNALISFLDPLNADHLKIARWVGSNLAEGWASCPLTENACLRVLTNPRYPYPVAPDVVLAKLDATKRGGNHAFWPDDVSITDAVAFDWNRFAKAPTGHGYLPARACRGARREAGDVRSTHPARSGAGKPLGTSGDALNREAKTP